MADDEKDKQSRTTSGQHRTHGQSGSDAQPKDDKASEGQDTTPEVTTETPEAIPAGLPVKVSVGTAPSQQRTVTAKVSQHVTVDANGVPINFSNQPAAENLMPGDPITLPYRQMESLARAGYVLNCDPADPAQMRALLSA